MKRKIITINKDQEQYLLELLTNVEHKPEEETKLFYKYQMIKKIKDATYQGK